MTRFWLSALMTLPLLALLDLLHQLLDLPFFPTQLWAWATTALPGVVSSVGFLLTLTAAVALDVSIGTALIGMSRTIALLLFICIGGLVGVGYAWLIRLRKTKPKARTGALAGALWGVALVVVSLAATPVSLSLLQLLVYGINGFLFVVWGLAVGWVYGRLAELTPYSAPLEEAPRQPMTRRRFVATLAAGALVFTLGVGAAGFWLGRSRRAAVLAQSMDNPVYFPASLQARIWPTPQRQTADWDFPEWAWPRYRPDTHPFGVAISGGGALSMAAAVGQIRGLQALGLLDAVGAISAVSGGAWFGAIFNYVPASIDDETLLGPVREPGELTLADLAELHRYYGAAPLAEFSTERVSRLKTELMVAITKSTSKAFNRIYARILNELMLKPFELDHPQTFFSLNAETVAQAVANNPGLTPANFLTMRPDRPYLIAGVAHAYPLGEAQRVRSFEITPLYTGTPQHFAGEGPDGIDIGGGYVESFAFDSVAAENLETDVDGERLVSTPTPNPPFLLADLLASTSAAPAVLLNYVGEPEWFPRFHHWPLPGSADDVAVPAPLYSFVDGATLDGTGIVALLRRRYPVILAFINTQETLGSTSPIFAVEGVTAGLAQLFGFSHPANPIEGQQTQIFPTEQFFPLRAALQRAKAEGRGVYFVGRYTIVQPNSYDLLPYPGDGKVTIVWFYNELNQGWKAQLAPAVQTLLESRQWDNDMSNFPNLGVFFQNRTAAGLPELLKFTPQQINLLAHMWCYTVMHDAGDTLLALREALVKSTAV
jgi:hypothetical protein